MTKNPSLSLAALADSFAGLFSSRQFASVAIAVLAVAAGLFLPSVAFAADVTNMNEQAKQVSTNLANLPRLIAMTCYVIGTFFTARSLFALKGYIQAPDDNPLNRVLSFGVIAALLILLPYTMSLMRATTGAHEVDVYSATKSFSDKGSGDDEDWGQCNAGGGTLYTVFCSLSTEFRYIPKFLANVAYAIGIALTFIALLNCKTYSEDPSSIPLRDIVMKFVVAALMISLPLAMSTVAKTVTGKGVNDQNISDVAIKRPCSSHGSAIGTVGGAGGGC